MKAELDLCLNCLYMILSEIHLTAYKQGLRKIGPDLF